MKTPAVLRSEEGHMAECWSEADGSVTLAENHCQTCIAAQAGISREFAQGSKKPGGWRPAGSATHAPVDRP